jgi:carboxymethylenebutenolidase
MHGDDCWIGSAATSSRNKLGDVTMQRDNSEDTAADPIDGLLTRREVMRRLALIGVTAAPTSLIAGCSGGARYWPFSRRRRRRR